MLDEQLVGSLLRDVGPARHLADRDLLGVRILDTSSISGESVRLPLADRGFAVRRGETFPGLGPSWIRLAVRDTKTHAELARAISDLTAHQPKEN